LKNYQMNVLARYLRTNLKQWLPSKNLFILNSYFHFIEQKLLSVEYIPFTFLFFFTFDCFS